MTIGKRALQIGAVVTLVEIIEPTGLAESGEENSGGKRVGLAQARRWWL